MFDDIFRLEITLNYLESGAISEEDHINHHIIVHWQTIRNVLWL